MSAIWESANWTRQTWNRQFGMLPLRMSIINEFCRSLSENFIICNNYFDIKGENCIGDVMVNMLSLSVVDSEYEPKSGQNKDDRMSNCCFSAKHAEKNP